MGKLLTWRYPHYFGARRLGFLAPFAFAGAVFGLAKGQLGGGIFSLVGGVALVAGAVIQYRRGRL
jgi:hypothetical protein